MPWLLPAPYALPRRARRMIGLTARHRFLYNLAVKRLGVIYSAAFIRRRFEQLRNAMMVAIVSLILGRTIGKRTIR